MTIWDYLLHELPPYALIAFMFYRAGWRDGGKRAVREWREALGAAFRENGDKFEFREIAALSSFERAQWTMAKSIMRNLAGKFRA